MQRRRYLALSTVALVPLAGCSAGQDGGGDPGTAVQVTTSSAEGVEIRVFQIAIPADADGPLAYYRLENTGTDDATVRLETVMAVQGGGTYRQFAVVTVPAGDEVTVSYQLVAFDELTEDEATKVRAGDVDLTVLVNGEERRDA